MSITHDGIHVMVPRDQMDQAAAKLRDTYNITPDAPFYQKEFGYYSLERWQNEGLPKDWTAFERMAGYDEPGMFDLRGLGECEAAFEPEFPVLVLEDRGEYEVVQDKSGRHLLCFKGRRDGFMPEYLDHPVKNMQTWKENCLWRMNPNSPERGARWEAEKPAALDAAGRGLMMSQKLVGGDMFLRSLIGPEQLLYKFYDEPDLIHACMEAWYTLADSVIAMHQKDITLDEVFFDEDICYNHGSLISPAMIQEFLFPYYKKLLDRIKKRQIDQNRRLYFHVDSDGYCLDVIPLYRELGMDAMCPFEVASGCDVAAVGKQYPDLVISGGVDKRVLAQGKDAIDEMVDQIFPAMRKRGGYIPSCDHGVPAEVSFENYMYYRKRCMEFSK